MVRPCDRPYKVTVQEAADELRMTPVTLRWLMDHGMIDLGFVKRVRPGAKGDYTIYRKQLDEEKKRRGIE